MSQNPPGDGPALVRYLKERSGQPARNPHPLFDSEYYFRRYPDVAAARINPLMHYIEWGNVHSYDPHWFFDAGFYCRTAKLPPGELPLLHYVIHGRKEGRTPHPLFDPEYYLQQNPDVQQAGADPLEHYLTKGCCDGRQPHPLFDPAYYLETHPDAAASGLEPMRYFLSTGAALGHNPHPLFSTQYYLQQTSNLKPEDALPHFIEHGHISRSSPHALFDSDYYMSLYSDVAAMAIDPLTHYLRFGVTEGRNPHPLFHTRFYSHRNKGELYGMNPLVHYARYGGTLQWSPHPLFDAPYYLQARPDVRRGGTPALVHYSACSGVESTDPHALFDSRYYRKQVSDLRSYSPLAHYVRYGWPTLNPHRLFDTAYYLAMHPESGDPAVSPLEHYLSNWSDGVLNPHPLFDSNFYLSQNPALQPWQSPLEHYRATKPSLAPDPHPDFDTRYYLEQVPELDETGLTALEHYLMTGAESGLDPNPAFHSAEYRKLHPELARSQTNPLVHYVLSKAGDSSASVIAATPEIMPGNPGQLALRVGRLTEDKPAGRQRSNKVILCMTHVVFQPPRAGNEYRFNRLLRHLEQQGYRTIVLFVPLEPVTDSVLRSMAAFAPDLIVCMQDGSLQYQVQQDESVLTALDGARIPMMPSSVLQENAPADNRAAELIQVDRTFSHDALCNVALHLHRHFQPCATLVNYIFMTRFLPFVPANSLKIIDTIDVFSTKARKVMSYGVDDGLSMSSQEERKRLLRGQLILAIQNGERQEFESIVPERRVLTVGVDFDVQRENPPAPPGKDILLIASDNPMNVKGLRDFLRFAWPIIARQEPDARLLVAGKVSHTMMSPHDRVSLLGQVDDVSSLYSQARVVINPAVAGTGLKIKTVEALCYLRPVVCWPNGFDGLEERVAKLCPVATNWFDFATQVVRVLRDGRTQWFSDEEAEMIRRSLSSTTVYRDLDATLQAYFENYDVEAAVARPPA
ncbi:MAG TPA: glycosyltransferase family 4 protein [Terriglobales bacterium]